MTRVAPAPAGFETGAGRAVGALLAMAVGAFCFVAMETLPVGLLPLIAAHFGISLPGAGLLVTGYGLTVAVATLPLAWVVRAVPRRRLLIVLLAVFVLATLASAAAPTYPLLLAARIVVALSQSVFWAVIGPAAAGLFSVAVRGRATATVFGGSSLAPMLGVPAGTWLGQQAGWRAAFFALAGFGLLALVLLVALMPSRPAGAGHATTGTAPSRAGLRLQLALTVLAITGLFAAYTYTAPFLTGVAGFAEADISVLLLVRGVTGLVGVVLAGALVDRHPHLVLIGSTALLTASLLGLGAFGGSRPATAALLGLSGLALGAMTPAFTARILAVAPGSTDLAAAGSSAAFNVGIAGGSYLGGAVLASAGLPATALAGGLLVATALALTVADLVVATRLHH